jgi:hypothetical protein
MIIIIIKSRGLSAPANPTYLLDFLPFLVEGLLFDLVGLLFAFLAI